MRDLAVQLAGILAVAAAVLHGVLGETRVFARARIEPEWVRRLIRLVWLWGTIACVSLAILLIAAPRLGSDAARNCIIATRSSRLALAPSATPGRRADGILAGSCSSLSLPSPPSGSELLACSAAVPLSALPPAPKTLGQ